jgi:hypothetical protein
MNIWTCSFIDFRLMSKERLIFATKEANSTTPRFTCGFDVVSVWEVVTEALASATCFLSFAVPSLFSPFNNRASLLRRLRVVSGEEDEEEAEEE